MNFFALWVKGAIKKVKADDKEGHLFAEYDTMYFTKEELERSLHLQKTASSFATLPALY
jgi:hypothetical protein